MLSMQMEDVKKRDQGDALYRESKTNQAEKKEVT